MDLLNLNSELIIIEVSGSDASSYLQGQLTNDIRELTTTPYQLAAHLNNKGRILATFMITAPSADTYYLITSSSVAATILPRLKMFILRSKVNLALSSHSIYLSSAALSNCHSFTLATGQFLNIGPANLNANIAQAQDLSKLLVELAIPMIYSATTEKIIPQQVNYDLIGGINFKKGCYTGQEIVARTHYLGKIKRRMVHFNTQWQPTRGQPVVSPSLDNQEVGFIIDYYPLEAGFRGRVALQSDCCDSAFLDSANTQQLQCSLIPNQAP